jgi:hypothetical protein
VSGTISQPPALSANESHDPILCHGGTTTVTISATGGTAPYTGAGTFTQGAGSHTYTVMDANGCTSSTTVMLSEPDTLVASNTHGTIACNGDSTNVVISATGGTAPYTGTGTFAQGVGSQTYTVTDANGCTSSTTVTLTQPPAVTFTIVPGACSSGNTGSITAIFGGGAGPYQVKIDSGSFAAATSPYIFTGLAAGSHTVTVRDNNGCNKSASISVNSCPAFCTLTQGAYGTAGGIYTNANSCYNGLGTLNLIKALLGNSSIRNCGLPNPDPLTVGKVGTRSLTIPLSAAACIMNRLPANGTASALPAFGDQTLAANTCQVPGSLIIPIKNGKFVNVLLGQTITLGLNLRLDPTLANLDLTTIGTSVVINRVSYRKFCTQGGDITTQLVPQTVIDALSNSTYVPDATHRGKVSGLLDLANRALAGQSIGSASLPSVNAAVDAINTGFDECQMLVVCPP